MFRSYAEPMSELLTRGVDTVIPRDLADQKAKEGKKMRVYWGIDPTGGRIHLGHSIPMRKLQQFAEQGHHAILLIGSFTAMIGDPTDKDSERKPLTKEEVQQNFATYKEQAAKILDFSKVEVVYNHEWLEPLSYADIIEHASKFTIQQMSERAMFQERMSKGNPVSVHEFLYPLMVGYDSVHLDVDCEIGGTDQEFNMLAGRTMQKAFGKREKFVLTTPLIEGTDGRKMSKSYNNCVYLDDEPNEMFGRMMAIHDNLMPTYFECCTDVPVDEVKEVLSGSPRDAKVRLAKEIVTMYHSAEAADAAEAEFTAVFSEGGVPEDMPEVSADSNVPLIDVLVDQGLVGSKSDARRMIEQGGIKKDDAVIEGIDAKALPGVYKVGKRKFIRLT